MEDRAKITWGKTATGELLNSWPKDEKGEPEEPVFLCQRLSTDLSDQLTVNMLKAYGIPSLCRERGDGGFGKLILGISGFGVEIYVPKSRVEDAKQLIEEENHEEL